MFHFDVSRSTIVIIWLIWASDGARGQECYDDGDEFCIDQNDILSVDLLPGSFIMMDRFYSRNKSRSSSGGDDDDKENVDGSFVTAFDGMRYHRKRMNEYLCHGFVAEEIFKEVGPARIKRRNGNNEQRRTSSLTDFLGGGADQNVTVHDKLLSDEGSKKYKDWLHKTTTLDDIYRHYAPNKVFKKKQEIHEDLEPEGEIEEFEGELTGYTVPSRHSMGKISKPGKADLFSAGTGYGAGGGGYPSYGPPQVSYGPPMHHPPAVHAYPPTIHEQHIHLPGNNYHDIEEEEYYPVHHEKSKGHELTIKDFFEIALTALAFLAFGLFVIQLLMYIHNPLASTTTAAPTVIAADLDQRFKRQVLQSRPDDPLAFAGGNEELDQLARRVMRSIEASLVAEADHGNCLRRALCEDNRYSLGRQDGQRIWIPVWSLGMSWAAGRVVPASHKWPAMLDSLKASLLGLGGADCASLYPDCQLRRERGDRRRRRRRRRKRR